MRDDEDAKCVAAFAQEIPTNWMLTLPDSLSLIHSRGFCKNQRSSLYDGDVSVLIVMVGRERQAGQR